MPDLKTTSPKTSQTSQTSPALIAGETSPELIRYLLGRRSVPRRNLTAPGPSTDEIATMIEAAARVPDHGKLAPWRFIVFKDSGKKAFTHILQQALAAKTPEMDSQTCQQDAEKITAAPLLIAVIFSPKDGKIPDFEQLLSTGAACQNLILAANALGYGINWLTQWYSENTDVCRGLGLYPKERIAGVFSIGTPQDPPKERPRIAARDITHYF